MSTTAIAIAKTSDLAGASVATAVLDNLAARFRPAGVFLVLLKPDGTVAYADPAAGMFFQRYVLPLLQYPEPNDPSGLRERVRQVTASSSVAVWNALPGIVLGAVPYAEKRQLVGVLMLAGKSSGFKLGEDIVRVCSKLGLDGIWLNQQAEELPTYGDEAIQRHARLLLSVMRDQLRLSSLEGELESISGQLADTYEELSLIYQISGGMRINRRATDFFKQACLDVMEVIGVRGMGVVLQADNIHRQEPVLYGQMSLPPGHVKKLGDELMRQLRQRKSAIVVNDLTKDKHFSWMVGSSHQLLAVPLQRQDQVLGCLFGIDKLAGDFNSVDSKLLSSIANESAIYLENAMLYDDVHGLMMGLLHSLTAAVDAKDAYTCGHSERVAMLGRTLARESGMPEAAAERYYMAGLLHDVGKIGVPEATLNKTGRLTPEEFDQLKKHPQIGVRILRDIRRIEDIIPGVLHHHERYDGKGYPYGLAGENIPIMGRIICLADCFDAMTSNRTYRKGMPLEVAISEIRRCSGTQFDPGLSEIFLKIGRDRLNEMLREHTEKSKKLADLQEQIRAA